MNLGAVILAAWYSSRMGGFKPLIHLRGRSLLSYCINLFESIAVEKVVVVTGHRSDELQQRFTESDVKFVHNPQYADGMFSSVCIAVRSLGDVDGFFVLPVDIPLIRQVTLEILVSKFDGEQVLYPQFINERGHPPLIPSALIPAILDHDGEGGLHSLLERFLWVFHCTICFVSIKASLV